ncbi:hypothetical protein L195_g064437, partial [Trifolium pratense]
RLDSGRIREEKIREDYMESGIVVHPKIIELF